MKYIKNYEPHINFKTNYTRKLHSLLMSLYICIYTFLYIYVYIQSEAREQKQLTVLQLGGFFFFFSIYFFFRYYFSGQSSKSFRASLPLLYKHCKLNTNCQLLHYTRGHFSNGTISRATRKKQQIKQFI